MRKLIVGVDVDDVLYSCNEYAVELANQTGNYSPPISIEEVTQWGKIGSRTDDLLSYYEKPEFVQSQPILPGAQRFIQELHGFCEVLFLTSVGPGVMHVRMERLMKDFPEIPKENIFIGSRKDLVKTDVVLDDCPIHIMQSKARYPVIRKRPWNTWMSGYRSIDSYEEFLSLVHEIDTERKQKRNRFWMVGNRETDNEEKESLLIAR